MTRKEAKESFLMEVQCALSQPGSKKIVSFEVIDQIYNDHEAQLKDKDEKLQQLDDAYASVVSDFESAVMELAKKDEAITELNHTVSGLNEMYLEAKEEIERLKEEDKDTLFGLCRGGKAGGFIMYNINEAKKARSIVAMLFWEWRKSEARIYATNIKWKIGRAFQSQILFEAAYKILKEQQ